MRILSGRYELLESLGQGGMGDVYRARDLELERSVAVKVLPSQFVRHPEFRTRFRREARAAAGLTHPGIAMIHDIGEDTGGEQPTPYLVMELIEGRTLAEVLQERGPFPPAEAAQIVIAVLDALEHSHSRDIVHRDIQPSNIMLTGNGIPRVKVMDFGIAKLLPDTVTGLTATGSLLGAPSYLSPEQARGERTDHRTDLYSLGCVYYELLTGRPPFVGENISVVLFQHLERRADPPSAHRRGIPARSDSTVPRSLEKDPRRRYQNAGEMRAAISARGGPDPDAVAFPAGRHAGAFERPRDGRSASGPRLAAFGRTAAERVATRMLRLATIMLILASPGAGRESLIVLLLALVPTAFAVYQSYRMSRPGYRNLDALVTGLVFVFAFYLGAIAIDGGGVFVLASGVFLLITGGIRVTRLLRGRNRLRTPAR
ncbi:hypothetical protein Misp01_44680 [Microtetraspora sp. NBRC 13810]|uniref:protein kinase domain-containing protein n=1 Tax=Microtetraspora sp. NBRC 13810 TaxID=3030990 RepID=UPI0024A2E319|nr:protein kinase [Microtetraspora sp. NBRC 13810]GLW09339.1 hypothetical protein Misp01_44680 [Microtetraspora sp. NBRC 13810]